jgi:cellulose synthase operon protein C
MTDTRTRESYGDTARCLATGLLLLACSKNEPQRAVPVPVLDAEYAGCAAVYAGPICTLSTDARELVFWAEVPRGTAFRVRAGDETLALAQEYVEGGVQIRATIPANATEVVLEKMAANEVESAFRLPIRPDDTPTEITEALALRGRGEFDQAETKIRPLLDSEDELVKTRARSTLARIELSRGNHERAAEIFEETSNRLLALGAISASAHDGYALSHVQARERWDVVSARAVLDRIGVTREFPENHALHAYYSAENLRDTGSLAHALERFRAAEVGARRLRLEQLEGFAVQRRAHLLQSLGRFADARDLLGILGSRIGDLSACDRAHYYTSVAWSILLAAESRAAASSSRTRRFDGDARPPLLAALREYRTGCNRATDIANVYVNLALEALHRGDMRGMANSIDLARSHGAATSATNGVWFALLEARYSAANGNPDEAVSLYAVLAQRCESVQRFADAWRARMERGRTLVELGRTAEAIADLQLAEQNLDAITDRIAVGDGKDAFAGERDFSARLLVDQLVQQDEVGTAFDVVRRARRRALQLLHAQNADPNSYAPANQRWSDTLARYWRARGRAEAESEQVWSLPQSALSEFAQRQSATNGELRLLLDEVLAARTMASYEDPPRSPAEGEVWLYYFPGVDRWFGFAQTRRGLVARALEPLDASVSTNELATKLLTPFRGALAQARRARIVSYGELDAIEFAHLPWHGTQLVNAMPVVYGVDLPQRGATSGNIALVVADPTEDLTEARREASALDASLTRRGYVVEFLEGAHAIDAAVVDALQRASLFHYAGHGVRGSQSSWDTVLPLSGGAGLGVGDVLALRRVPNEVILAACDAGASNDGSAGVPSFTLARAFVAAGAEHVVASSSAVGDRDAAQFSATYHRERLNHLPDEAFRLAMLEQQGRVPYRMYVP